MIRMFLALVIISFSLMSCNSDNRTEEEIEAINQAVADSLLQDALKDTVGDQIVKDSIIE